MQNKNTDYIKINYYHYYHSVIVTIIRIKLELKFVRTSTCTSKRNNLIE